MDPGLDPLTAELIRWGAERIYADIIDDPLRATRTETLVARSPQVQEAIDDLGHDGTRWRQCIAVLIDDQMRQLRGNAAELAVLSYAAMSGTEAGAWYRPQIGAHYESAVKGLVATYELIFAAGRVEPITSTEVIRGVVDEGPRPALDLGQLEDWWKEPSVQIDSFLVAAMATVEGMVRPINPEA
jgi:hypothetical protein